VILIYTDRSWEFQNNDTVIQANQKHLRLTIKYLNTRLINFIIRLHTNYIL
jgi:hypothetical protein